MGAILSFSGMPKSLVCFASMIACLREFQASKSAWTRNLGNRLTVLLLQIDPRSRSQACLSRLCFASMIACLGEFQASKSAWTRNLLNDLTVLFFTDESNELLNDRRGVCMFFIV